jgi:hypothetical protein
MTNLSTYIIEKKYVYQIGFWSSSISTLLVAGAGITATASIQPLATIMGFLLTLSFLVVMGCIHCYASEERKVFSFIGLSFAIIYATIISVNYFIQLTFVGQKTFDASMFDMGNTQSMMWVFEVLGYFFMGVSTLFAAPVFGSGRLERCVKWLFVINGVLGLLTPIAYVTNLPMNIMLGGLIVWDIVMPLATASLALLFKNYLQTRFSCGSLEPAILKNQIALSNAHTR